MKSKERKTKEKVELKLNFYKEDLISTFNHLIAIRAFVQRGQDVPAELLQKFLTVFEKPFTDDLNARRLVIETAKNYALLNLIPDQDFNITVERGEIEKEVREKMGVADLVRFDAGAGTTCFSLTDFLTKFFSGLEENESYTEIIYDKRRLVEYSSTLLGHYLRSVPEKKRPAFYQLAVIVGYLAVSFGLIADEETYLKTRSKTRHYTEYLYQRTIRIYKKVNPQSV